MMIIFRFLIFDLRFVGTHPELSDPVFQSKTANQKFSLVSQTSL